MTTRARSARHKRDFLTHFAKFGNITTAAALAGVDRRTIYKWQEIDDQFVAAFRDADIQATEVLEHEARRRAVEGVEKKRRVYDNRGNLIDEYTEQQYSDTLLIFLLKARAPEKYRDRIGVEHSGSIDTTTEDLDRRIASRLAAMEARGESAPAMAPGSSA